MSDPVIPEWLARWHASGERGPALVDLRAHPDTETPRAFVARAGAPAAPPSTPSEAEGGAATTEDVRTLTGLAVPWHTPVIRWGLRVQFTPESTRVPDDVTRLRLLVEHDPDRPVGYATSTTHADDGLRIEFAAPTASPRVVEALADVDLGLRDGLSVGVELDEETVTALWDAMWEGQEDGAALTLAGTVRETSLVSVPQFVGARVGASAVPALATFTSTPTPGGLMPTTTAPPAEAEAPAMSMAELAAALAPHLGTAGPGTGHPLGRFASLGDFILATREGDTRTEDGHRLALALADQATPNNPGVLPPTWLTEVQGIIDRGRPAVTAMGGPGDAGDTGMTITWPYYDGDLDVLVDEQAAQKTEVTTGRVDIKSGNVALKTYAGASDISYQLIRRSSPSYREIYGRILTLAWAARTDAVFSTALATASVPGTPWDGATAESLLASIFEASDAVDDATGQPASVVLAAPDMFALIGAGLGLYPPQYGTNNVAGTSTAATLRVNVSGLDITKARHLAPGTVLVSNPLAARWREDGPFAVEADDVALLGRDVGIWGMGATTVFAAAGIVSVAVQTLPLAASAKGK